jgi:hypothetical protein
LRDVSDFAGFLEGEICIIAINNAHNPAGIGKNKRRKI